MNCSAKIVSFQKITRVIIVAESPIELRNVRAWIDASDHFRCVRTCGSAKQALNEVPKLSADVILVDTHLGQESGIGCAAKLKEQCPGLHVIMLSDSQEHETVFSAFKAGASGFLLKSSSCEEILWAIAEVQAGGAPMTREIARRVVEGLQRAPAEATLIAKLSPREHDVLTLLSKGKSTKQIASDLGISYQTACVHLRRIYEKLGVRCRTEAVIKYLHSQGDLVGSSSSSPWQLDVPSPDKALVVP